MNSDADGFYRLKSPISGKTIFINRSSSFLVVPKPDLNRARALSGTVLEYITGLPEHSRVLVRDMPIFLRFQKLRSQRDLELALSELMELEMASERVGRRADLLIALRAAEAVVWPRRDRKATRNRPVQIRDSYKRFGNLNPYFAKVESEFDAADKAHLAGQATRKLIFINILLCSAGISDIRELSPEVVVPHISGTAHATAIPAILVQAIHRVDPTLRDTIKRSSYGKYGPDASRSDDHFKWVAKSDSTLEEWRSAAVDWFQDQKKSRLSRRYALNVFFDVLLKYQKFPRSILAALKTSQDELPGIDFAALQSRESRRIALSHIGQFFDWLLDTRCVAEGDDGRPYRVPGFRNPIVTETKKYRPAETYREALPTRYVRILREIIEEDDYAWPRKFGDLSGIGRGDYLAWRDPESGEWKRVWSPVRAMCILIKLELPLRTYQVRMLNSGEGDAERYELMSKTWVKNDHVLAGSAQKPMGVLRRAYDLHAERDCVGLFINTNKTADSARDESDRGYLIPWEHERVIGLLSELRLWQETYNPIKELKPWESLNDPYVRNTSHISTLVARGSESFLFRDAVSERCDEPLTENRIRPFWFALCEELERRLALLGETGPNGEPLRLVRTRNGAGTVTSVVFDLHSLRVTMLTALAERGVPVGILMKVAGHSTAIMALYYQKLSIVHISEVLTRADAARFADEQTNWERYIKASSYESLEAIVAWNDRSALYSIRDGTGASWQRMDHGVCPVGCMRCDDGGELINEVFRKYGPVPGGAQNCVRCRFFITGPAFLIGLVAYFNDKSFRVSEASRRFAEAEAEFLRCDQLRLKALDQMVPFLDIRKWQIASSTHTKRLRELDELILTWHATYRLIEKCQQILRDRKGPDGESPVALVPVGDLGNLETAIEVGTRSEREFELLDAISQTAEWFPSIDAELPNLKRMRYIDAMLQRNGQEPVFLALSESEGLRAANELCRFMFTQFGREDTVAVMNGQKLLRALGIDAENRVLRELVAVKGRDLQIVRDSRTRSVSDRSSAKQVASDRK